MARHWLRLRDWQDPSADLEEALNAVSAVASLAEHSYRLACRDVDAGTDDVDAATRNEVDVVAHKDLA